MKSFEITNKNSSIIKESPGERATEYQGFKYRSHWEEESDNRKIFHWVIDPAGKKSQIDWSPYSHMTQSDFILWLSLGQPDYRALGPDYPMILAGPLDSTDLDLLARRKKEYKNNMSEAWLYNHPENGYEISPDGGMGSWSKDSLTDNLLNKFAAIAELIKNGEYTRVKDFLYKHGVVKSMIDALAQLEKFQKKQGNRPIAKGRQIDLTQS